MKTMKMMGLMALTAVAMSFGAGGCDSTGPNHSAQFTQSGQKVELGGTVVFREGNNAFYGILADNGGQYEPVNLDAKFRTDGQRIYFSGILDTANIGEHRWGNPIELASVSAAK